MLSTVRGLLLGAKMDPADADSAKDWLRDFTVVTAPTGPLLDRMWQLRANLSAYAAGYLAAAESHGLTLVTADARIARARVARCPIRVITSRVNLATARARIADVGQPELAALLLLAADATPGATAVGPEIARRSGRAWMHVAEFVDEPTLNRVRSELARVGTAAVLDRTVAELADLVAQQA